jgi:hydrophobic/amphiphilic exporter-1 (mainly G- bacteria), HAE1 family
MIRFFAAHPTAANLLMIALLAMGIMALPSLRRETFPDFAANEAEVRVIYPGAGAQDVEEAVCARIEDALDGVNDVEEMRSESREGVGVVTVEMREGGDFGTFLDEIRTEIDAIDDLPDLTEDPVVRELGRTNPVVSIAVTGAETVVDLKILCEQIKDRLQQAPDVSLVRVRGFSDHQLRVEVAAETLRALDLSVESIAAVISRQGIDLPAGSIITTEREYLLRFTDERRTPAELADLVVVTGDVGTELRLGDIATVTDRFELDEDKILFDGRRAGLLDVSMTKSEDTLVIFDAVAEFVERERGRLPPGVRLELTRDSASIVRDRLQMLVKNGWQGLVLVFLCMALFFSGRFSFWVVMGLPVSFLGAFFFLPLIGFSINMITMVGMLLALGLLMDDAIVLAENVAAHRQRGKSAFKASVDGIMEVKNGVLASFVTTLCVFAPLGGMEGHIGKVLRVMPVILILVLSVSLVEAFLILPHHLAHTMRGQDPKRPSRFRAAFDRVIDGMREKIVGRAVDFVVSWRYLVAGVALMLIIVSIAQLAGGRLKFKAFPEIDGDVIEARVLLPSGTPLARTEEVAERITRALSRVNDEFAPRQPDGADLVRHVSVRFSENQDAHEAGSHLVTIGVDLLSAETRDARIDDVLGSWRREVGTVPDVLALVFTEPGFGPAGRAIEIRLQGEDTQDLFEGAHEVRSYMSGFVGVFDLYEDLRPGKPELRLRLLEGATSAGLDARTIASQIRAAFHGATAREIQVGSEAFEIDVRLREVDRNARADLLDFRVALPDGTQIPLMSVAAVEEGRGFARLARIDGRRTVTVEGNLDPLVANTGEVMGFLKREFLPGFLERHPGIEVSLEGEVAESAKTGASVKRAFLIGLIGVFILLSFQFRSFVEPLLVMVSIPFALVGVIWGHMAMGLPLTMPSMVGFVSLAGVVVNDSILLVEFVKRRGREGMSASDAACQASRERFRAVLLTSLTTIAGLLPLLAERSLQAQILVPLATSIVFGLLASTMLVLFILPALYAILDDLGGGFGAASRRDSLDS